MELLREANWDRGKVGESLVAGFVPPVTLRSQAGALAVWERAETLGGSYRGAPGVVVPLHQ